MTANELLNKQLADVSYQLDKVLDGVSESDLDFKICPTAMSIRETVEHLCEVYVVVEKESRGEKHSWGTYAIEDKSWSNLSSEFVRLRKVAVDIVSKAETDKEFETALAYILAHDYYHVGQLASVRLATNPEWDAYSIYNH